LENVIKKRSNNSVEPPTDVSGAMADILSNDSFDGDSTIMYSADVECVSDNITNTTSLAFSRDPATTTLVTFQSSEMARTMFNSLIRSAVSDAIVPLKRQFGFKKATGCRNAIYVLKETVDFLRVTIRL